MEGQVATLLASQRTFYDLRAPDYRDESKPSDRYIPANMAPETAEAIVDGLRPDGDVLELACGNGFFTQFLARYATSLTAVDSSPRMLDRCRTAIGDRPARLVLADIFDWRPDHRCDMVFFGFWLSHVPPTAFEGFWTLVLSALQPGGSVVFVDEDVRGEGAIEKIRLVGGVPSARRTLVDGRQFDIVKVFWEPARLRDRLRQLGWEFTIRTSEEATMIGVGRHLQ
jgi:SAM-dependent methyltransferase